MEENRLALRCLRCGEELALARLQAEAEAWSAARPAPTRDTLATYFDTHSRHDGRVLHVELVADNATDLRIL